MSEIPTAYAYRDKENNYLVVFECPYCHQQHRHGGGETTDPFSANGHRMSHCSGGEDKEGIGYYVSELSPIEKGEEHGWIRSGAGNGSTDEEKD